MFKNNINLLTLFSILMLCAAAFSLSLAGQFLQDINRHDNYNDDWEMWAFTGFTILGISWLIAAIGLLMRKHWARTLINIFLTILVFVWAGTIYYGFSPNDRTMPVIIGISVLIFGILGFCLLYLNNAYVLEHFEDKNLKMEKRDDILDY